MPNRRRAMLMVAVCSASLVAVPAVHAETLVSALTDAYQTNPTLQIQRINQRNADESYLQGLVSNLDPAPLTLQLNQSAVLDGRPNTANAPILSNPTFSGLSLSQALNTGGTLNRNLTRNEIALFRARDTLRQNEQTTMRTVINDYIALLNATKSLEIARASLITSQRNLDNFQAQFDVGTAIRSDVETNRVSLLSAQNSLQQAQNVLATAKTQYTIDIGHTPDNDIEAPPPLPNVPTSYEEALSLALQWGPTWRSAVYTDRLAELTLADAKIRPLPTARATLGYSLAGGELRTNAVPGLVNNDQLTASLSVSVPLYSFGTNASLLRVALQNRNSAKITLDNTRDQLVQSIENSWNSLVNARSSVQISEASLVAQTLSTQGQRALYQIGGGLTVTELLRSEDSLRSAQRNLINAKTSLYTSEANLLQQIGLLDPRYLIPNVTPYDPLEYFERMKNKFVIMPYKPVLTAVDSLFAPKLAPIAADARLPDAKVDAATPLPPLATMAPAPDEATAKSYELPKVPDAPPPPPAMIPIPAVVAVDPQQLQQNGPPGGAGGRGGGPAGGGGGGGGGGGRGGG